MRKYLRNITVGAALLLLAGSCTDKFEEYNTNQYQIHDAPGYGLASWIAPCGKDRIGQYAI